MIGIFPLFKQQLSREWLLQVRELRQVFHSCLFFLMVMVFFPLTMPPVASLLRMVTPGLVWVALLLALLLSADRLFHVDAEDGVLEQWFVSGYPASVFVSAKITIHWLLTLLPILIFCPLLSVLYALNFYETSVMMLGLFCGTPALLGLCALAAAFCTGLQQKGMVMALILLPLTIPILIFGSGALNAAMLDLPVSGYLALLLAMSLVAFCTLPFAIASVLRINGV